MHNCVQQFAISHLLKVRVVQRRAECYRIDAGIWARMSPIACENNDLRIATRGDHKPSAEPFFVKPSKGIFMKYSIMFSAVALALSLSACERPTVVTPAPVVNVPAPAPVPVPVPVPGPPGPAGAPGAPGAPGTAGTPGAPAGDTVIVVPPPPAR